MNVRAARLTTRVLAAICGALLLLLVVQYAGFGRGYRWDASTAAGEDTHALPNIDQQMPTMPPAGAYAAIDAHPLFNEDREPSPVDALADADADAPPANPLNVQLTGVIIDDANHVRVAMLLDRTRNQPISLKVGMPLEGDQAAWTLVELKPRVAVFRNAAAETSEVELETAGAPATPAGVSRPAPGRGVATSTPQIKTDAAADDLAKRIEERRRQMREEAERNRKEPASPAPGKK